MFYYFLNPGGVWRCICQDSKYPIASSTPVLCTDAIYYPPGLKHVGSNLVSCTGGGTLTAEVYTDDMGFAMLASPETYALAKPAVKKAATKKAKVPGKSNSKSANKKKKP